MPDHFGAIWDHYALKVKHGQASFSLRLGIFAHKVMRIGQFQIFLHIWKSIFDLLQSSQYVTQEFF